MSTMELRPYRSYSVCMTSTFVHSVQLAGAAALFSALILGCGSNPENQNDQTWPGPGALPDVQVAQPPFVTVEVKWKERLREPYIYLANVGDYRGVGPRISELFQKAQAQGAPIVGAPFVLFYDDASEVPLESLRARICLTVGGEFTAKMPLLMDELRAEMVVYAAIGGAYSEVPRAYPKLFDYMAARNWAMAGPIRESYLVSPAGSSAEDLVTEVQIPWGPAK